MKRAEEEEASKEPNLSCLSLQILHVLLPLNWPKVSPRLPFNVPATAAASGVCDVGHRYGGASDLLLGRSILMSARWQSDKLRLLGQNLRTLDSKFSNFICIDNRDHLNRNNNNSEDGLS